MLLNSDKSILNFLQRTATPKHKDLARAREHMFDFLGEYVKLLGQSVQEYALAIKVRSYIVYPTRAASNMFTHLSL
jgi:hypothetical protein